MNRNQQRVADYLVSQEAFPGTFGIQRSQISKDLEMKRTTVYDALARLEEKGLVQRLPKPNGQVGRAIVTWVLTTEEF